MKSLICGSLRLVDSLFFILVLNKVGPVKKTPCTCFVKEMSRNPLWHLKVHSDSVYEGHFLRVAQDTSLIVGLLDYHLSTSACHQQRDWKQLCTSYRTMVS